jgi:hypothetical protein
MSVTPTMVSTVPCDGQEQTIYARNQAINATVFVKYLSTDCKFTARLYRTGPGGAPQLEVELVIPAGGGYRAVGGLFEKFVVVCEPAPPPAPGPQAQAPGRRQQRAPVPRRPAHKEDCKFEWYVVF